MNTPQSVFALALAASTLLAHAGYAAVCGGHGDRNSMVVSTAWLNGHLKDSNLVILAIGEKAQYDAGHIPGSLFLDYMETHTMPSDPKALTVELPPMPLLAEVFGKLGVTNSSRVVLYYLDNWHAQTARVYLTLEAMGLGRQESILDGGLPVWKGEGRPLSTEARPVKRGKLELCPQNDVIADLAFVRANLHRGGVGIVDSRLPEFYTGARQPRDQRLGHIPGAVNIAFNSLMDEQGRLKPVSELQKKFEAAGIKTGDQVISYCHIGQQASLVYFVARYLGHDARMYDGSWQEWSAHSELPAEVAPSK